MIAGDIIRLVGLREAVPGRNTEQRDREVRPFFNSTNEVRQ
jgi:hypothetical protein